MVVRVGVLERVLHHVGDHPVEQPGVGGHRRQVVGRGDRDRLGPGDGRAASTRATEARSTSAVRAVMLPVCSRLMSSRLATRASSRSADSSTVASRSSRSCADQAMAVLRRLEDGGLDRGQRAAQVVGHRRQQRGLGPVALVQLPGPDGVRLRPGGVPPGRRSGRRRRSAGAGRRPPAAGDREAPGCRPAPASTRATTSSLEVLPQAATRPGRRRAGSTSAAPVMPSTSPACRSSSAGSSPERSRLWASTARVLASVRAGMASCGPAGGPVDDRGDGHAHEDEDHDGERVLRVGDGEGAGGRHEQEVQGETAQHRGQHRRPQTAEQGGGHHDGQHQHRLGRQPVQVGGQASSPSASSAVPSTASR